MSNLLIDGITKIIYRKFESECIPKTSVGLVVMIDGVPQLGAAIVLQARGVFNPERMKPESWPGICQVTVHGGVGEGESLSAALEREAVGEIGRKAAALLMSTNRFVELCDVTTPRERVVTFGVRLHPQESQEFLGVIQWGPASGGMRLLDDIALIEDASKLTKERGTLDLPGTTIAMFPDEAEAIRMAFEKLDP